MSTSNPSASPICNPDVFKPVEKHNAANLTDPYKTKQCIYLNKLPNISVKTNLLQGVKKWK